MDCTAGLRRHRPTPGSAPPFVGRGRKNRLAKAEMHRIGEVVAALYRFKPLQIPPAEGDALPNYTSGPHVKRT